MAESIGSFGMPTLEKLAQHGWIKSVGVSEREVGVAVKEYQGWHGIKVDGVVGRVTEASLNATRFCPGHADRMEARDGVCKFNKNKIKWRRDGSLQQFDDVKFHNLIVEGLKAWSDVCDIKFEHNSISPDIIINTGTIDGAGRTLAWSKLPCGNVQKVDQKYDTRERWVAEDTGLPAGVISFLIVFRHEIGHAIGLPHAQGAGSLMSAIYDPNIRLPQAYGVEQSVARYGERATDPSGPIDPVDPSGPTSPQPSVGTIMIPASLDGRAGVIEQRFIPQSD